MNRHFSFLTLLFVIECLVAQTEVNIIGNVTVHEQAQLGIHTNFFGSADVIVEDNTLVGFYGGQANSVDGIAPITLFDVEFGNEMGTFLQLPLRVRHNANFISSNVFTAQNNTAAFLEFGPNAFYTGDSDATKVVGYTGLMGQSEFTFPVGTEDKLRPLVMNSQANGSTALCTYINENPGESNVTNELFNGNSRSREVNDVSSIEFWRLEYDQETTITLSWDLDSGLFDLANDVSEIILVGWSKSTNQWLPLGPSDGVGTLDEGFISSSSFIPNRYGAITFASKSLATDTFAVNNPTLGEYFLSPNGDGINDTFIIDNIEEFNTNLLVIYNKFGQKVFEQANYVDQFVGVSNVDNLVLSRDIGLPEGIYYYVIELPEIDLQYQGFLFLDR